MPTSKGYFVSSSYRIFLSPNSQITQENVLVNDFGSACITDFGLSTIWNDRTLPSMTVSAMQGRTPRYLAPELMNDDTRPSLASDMWAFGVVCYEV